MVHYVPDHPGICWAETPGCTYRCKDRFNRQMDSIYFGGNYYFDLTEGSPEEVRANVEKAMDGLINEGVGTVLSGGMEYL